MVIKNNDDGKRPLLVKIGQTVDVLQHGEEITLEDRVDDELVVSVRLGIPRGR